MEWKGIWTWFKFQTVFCSLFYNTTPITPKHIFTTKMTLSLVLSNPNSNSVLMTCTHNCPKNSIQHIRTSYLLQVCSSERVGFIAWWLWKWGRLLTFHCKKKRCAWHTCGMHMETNMVCSTHSLVPIMHTSSVPYAYTLPFLQCWYKKAAQLLSSWSFLNANVQSIKHDFCILPYFYLILHIPCNFSQACMWKSS